MTYIIKTKQAMICYYYQDGRLLKRIRNETGLSGEISVMSGVRPGFSLNLTDEGKVCIFCRDLRGNIIFLRDEKEGVKGKTILESMENIIKGNILFDAHFGKEGIDLIFNAPLKDGFEGIYFQKLSKNKTAPVLLDEAKPLKGEAFRAVRAGGGLRLLFYYKAFGVSRGSRLGYRELLGERAGGFNTVFETGLNFEEYSMLIRRERFYFAAVITSFFTSKLIFKTRGSEGFSDLKTAADMKGISSPLVFLFDRHPVIFFKCGGRAYICLEDFKPQAFKGKICEDLKRGVFIDKNGGRIKADEVLVNAEKPWDAQIYPEMDDNFLSFHREKPMGDYRFKDFFDKKGSELL
ncbi:MAG: hypothetical protein LUC92_05220 [Clostridiales bacterium]|nr:hypothetical protein [Clostridiales bacterium]